MAGTLSRVPVALGAGSEDQPAGYGGPLEVSVLNGCERARGVGRLAQFHIVNCNTYRNTRCRPLPSPMKPSSFPPTVAVISDVLPVLIAPADGFAQILRREALKRGGQGVIHLPP